MFRFRLQRVLELRERKERDAATALVAAQEEAERARAEQERLLAVRDALAARAAPATADAADDEPGVAATSVGALRTLQFLLGRLDERVAAASHETASADGVVAQRREELNAAFRDRRTIDRLRERDAASWRAAESAADRLRMDEIALARFTQASTQQANAEQANAQPASAEQSATSTPQAGGDGHTTTSHES